MPKITKVNPHLAVTLALLFLSLITYSQKIDSLIIGGVYRSFIIGKYFPITRHEFNKLNPDFDAVIKATGQYKLRLPSPFMQIFQEKKYAILNECVQFELNRSQSTVQLRNGKIVILGRVLTRVPEGKVWTLPTNQEVHIEVSEETIRAGNRCYAAFYSYPAIVGGIVESPDTHESKVYTIIAKKIPVQQGNPQVFILRPVSIVLDLYLGDLKRKEVEEIGYSQVSFYPGQELQVQGCLSSITLIETSTNRVNKMQKK